MRFISSSLLLLLAVVSLSTPVHAGVISEFRPAPAGRDPLTQQIELRGMAGTAYRGYVLGIGGEFGRAGTVDTSSLINGTFDSNGLLVATIGDLLDPTHTIVLVTDYDQSAPPADIDTNDDGIIDDISRLIGVQDAIGIPDSTTDLFRLYGSQLGGQDFAFTGNEPQLVFRDASMGDWYAINNPNSNQIFDINAVNVADTLTFNGDPFNPSFGSINPSVSAVPEPGSFVLLGGLSVAGIVTGLRRRKRSPQRASR
ncbi:PEP-CTERM sorting domain-containing protein [Allorhodopirellula solitaria]|uniref:Ice-binding protein C-terminal domain-containing protein n=1 Tax=Allorhodopirellula solitaria TaxID=2527987 RepID=A0A5C5XT98_9BACT|nr:PEP-CTERM sorting domain-containing protein [Allorhodopirellula solitaria]TWT66094.1 hypothetical protein CA85_29580 [Allorhodopirellula solitaria]